MNGPDTRAAVRALSPPETHQALYDLAHGTPADQAIVEIGTFYGATAIALGQGARDGAGAHVWTIDSHDLPGYRTTTSKGPPPKHPIDYTDPAIRAAAQHAIHDAGLADHVTMVREFSEDAGQGWDGPLVGLLFVDGDHREGAVRRDFAAWERRLATHAAVVFDDYTPAYPGVMICVQRLVDRGILTEPLIVGTLAITQMG